MTNKLITFAAFVAAVCTVVFKRVLLPMLTVAYTYVDRKLSQQPQLAPAPIAVVAEAVIEDKPKPTVRKARRRKTSAKPLALVEVSG